MLYSKLAQLYEDLENTTKRLEKIDILSKFLLIIPENESDILYLLLGNIYAQSDESKIGISEKLAIKAIARASGTSAEKVTSKWKSLGDLGLVSHELMENKKQSTLASHILTTKKVLDNLRKLPLLEGQGTIDKKLGLITELLSSAKPIEAKFLIRTLIGDLRIGLQESTIRSSLAKAFFERTPEIEKKIQEAIDKLNDMAKVFEIAKERKIKKLEEISLEVGNPIKVMLGPKAESLSQAFEALGRPLIVEYKYDGFRLMIHKKENKISLFTRRLENVTKQFPEVVEYITKYTKGRSFILDTEAVGFDSKTKKYKPFQDISQRIRRKYNIEEIQKKLPVEINVFDILYYNGKSLIEEPIEEREELIKKIIKETPYKIIPSKYIITSKEAEAEEFYQKALEDNQEGVFFKKLGAAYKPGKRVGNWLKLKPDQRDFDLVITGAEWGTGKRSNWLSSFTLSCRQGDDFLELGKMGTGIKEKSEEEGEATFEKLTEILKPLIIKEKGKEVKIKPKIVIAVTYQEIQKSTNYSSGFALRFPRLTALRPDKPLREITILSEVKKEYEEQ